MLRRGGEDKPQKNKQQGQASHHGNEYFLKKIKIRKWHILLIQHLI
jgi:hypothetical protein